MRTPIEALKEIRDRLTYFCLRTDGKYDPPWATELVGIIDDIIKYKKNTDDPFYVDIGTSVVAIRCSSNHDVVHRLDHVYRKGSIDYLEQMCARMNEEALGLQKHGNAAAMREALLNIQEYAAAMDVDDGNVLAILDACRDALSAPARNCDLFDNWYDAHKAWERLPKDEIGYFVAANGVHECEQAWLFEPAAERKGEGDGR